MNTQMNSRVKQLVEQAQDMADDDAPFASEEQEYFARYLAKLLVQECLSIIDQTDNDLKVYPAVKREHDDVQNQDEFQRGWNACVFEFTSVIRSRIVKQLADQAR